MLDPALVAAYRATDYVLFVEAGLEILEAGGDFADGVIAYEGRWLGGEAFVSFDAKAVNLLERRGRSALALT